MSRSSCCGGVAETPLSQQREEMSMCGDAAIQGSNGTFESMGIYLNVRYASGLLTQLKRIVKAEV